MNWLKTVIELFATVFENFIILDFLGKSFGYKFKGARRRSFFCIALLLASVYVTFLNVFMLFEGWLNTIIVIIFTIYGLFCLKGTWQKKILLPIFTSVIILTINISVTYLFALLFGEHQAILMSSESSVRLLALFITKFSFFIITKIIMYIFKKDDINLRKSDFAVICTMFILSNSIAISNIEIQIGQNQAIFNLVSSFCVVAINIFIFLTIIRISKQNKNKIKMAMQEMQIHEQKAMIKDAGHLSKEIKRAEHDIKHHLISLLGTLEEGEYVKAKDYIQSLLREYETSIFKYITIENSAVNSVLNFKIGRCKADNIDIKLEIESEFENIDTMDICVVISNLLDNAIEGSAYVYNPKIFLQIKDVENYFCIAVKNKIEESVLKITKS